MTSFSILITSSPFSFANHIAAQRYVRELAKRERVEQIFFYSDATLVCNASQTPPQGQQGLLTEWLAIANEFGIPLKSCIANSVRRGILNQTEAERYNKPATCHPGIQLVGLGDMAEAHADGHKVVQF